jgi:hypothetical protein
MGKAIDALSIVLLLAAASAFALGVTTLAEHKDLIALYWLVVGGLTLHAAVQLLRPRSNS